MADGCKHRDLLLRVARNNPDVAALQFMREEEDSIIIEDISSDGLMNYVYRVTSADNKHSVVLKHAPPYIRMRPDEVVSLDRQLLEYRALKLLHSIDPGMVPTPYCLDMTDNVLVMEDMRDWELLGYQLQRGHVDLEAASHLGRQIARLHMATARKHLTPEEWARLKEAFGDEKTIEEGVTFLVDRPLQEEDHFNVIPDFALSDYRDYVAEIKDQGLDKKAFQLMSTQECFIHFDAHWKGIFIKEGQAAVFDLEFAYLGHPAYNVAVPLTAYLFCYNERSLFDGNEAVIHQFQTQCIHAMRNYLTAYLEARTDFSTDVNREQFMSTVCLLLGAALFLFGLFEAMDEHGFMKDANRHHLLKMGFRAYTRHKQCTNIDDLLQIILEL